jgi:integrase/recombinase XerD
MDEELPEKNIVKMEDLRGQFGKHYERYAKLRSLQLTERSMETERDAQKSLWKYLVSIGFEGDELAVTREVLQDYAEHLFSRKDLKRNTGIHLVQMLKSFYTEAFKQGWISENPYRNIKLPKREQVLINVLSVKQMKELLELPDYNTNVSDMQTKTIMELMYSCGLRCTETLSLTADAFHDEYRTLHIKGKGEKTAYLPVGRVAAHFLKHWIEEVHPKINIHKVPEIFISLQTRRKMDKQTLWSHVRKFTKQIVPDQDIGTHFFKYSITSHLADEGVDARILMQFSRHERLHTTMKYVKQSFQKMQEVFRQSHPRS